VGCWFLRFEVLHLVSLDTKASHSASRSLWSDYLVHHCCLVSDQIHLRLTFRCVRGDRPMLLEPLLAQQFLRYTLRCRHNNQYVPFCIKQFRHRQLLWFDNPSNRPGDHIWFHGSLRERSEIFQHRCLLMKRHEMDSSKRHDECCINGIMMRNQVYMTRSRASQGWGTKSNELSIRASVNRWNQRRLLDPICNAKARSLILSTDVF
jgi:hypothetical protein